MVQEAYAKAGRSLPSPILLPELAEHHGPEVLAAIMPEFIEKFDKAKAWSQMVKAQPELARKNHLRIFHYFMEIWAKGELGIKHPSHLQDWTTFRKCVSQGVEKIISDEARGLTVAAFTSGGTVSAAMGHALEMTNEERIIELNGKVKNTSITSFLFSKGRIALQSFNEVAHLEKKEMITYV